MLPFFFNQFHAISIGDSITLDESNSKHIAQVLRMKEGDFLNITNGKGQIALAEITLKHKKNTTVKVTEVKEQIKKTHEQWLAISFTKNRTRTEWLIEKATELGISGIVPLSCQRSERSHWNHDRLQKIMIAAMLQSQQAWLPQLEELTTLENLIQNPPIKKDSNIRWGIAHCLEDEKQSLLSFLKPASSHIICIGPEGDFTPEEIDLAKTHGMSAVSLGDTRLRTETAGIYVATLLNVKSYETV